jgi:hypothetical protein
MNGLPSVLRRQRFRQSIRPLFFLLLSGSPHHLQRCIWCFRIAEGNPKPLDELEATLLAPLLRWRPRARREPTGLCRSLEGA